MRAARAVLLMFTCVGFTAQGAEISGAAGKIMTVNGPVDPASIGPTLMHEHMLADFTLPFGNPQKWLFSGRKRPVVATDVSFLRQPLDMSMLGEVMMGKENNDNRRLNSDDTARRELEQFRQAGGTALVELTSVGAGREPERLRQLSKTAGVQVVMGTGLFAQSWYPDEVDSQTVERLAAQMVRDVTVGVDGTDIRSGIIGEIRVSGRTLSPAEEKVIRAAGRASRQTGAAVSLHVSKDSTEHLKVLDILEREGTDRGRIILGNANYLARDVALLEKLLQRGVYIQFDGFGRPPRITIQSWGNSEVADVIVRLVRAGFGERILLSQDIAQKADLQAYGGPGYTFVMSSVLPYLRQKGLTDTEIDTLMIGNPRRILTLAGGR